MTQLCKCYKEPKNTKTTQGPKLHVNLEEMKQFNQKFKFRACLVELLRR
uniref:Uncharacterized protein n=1 Tax=Arundo donax TaxID=35708 RepID=A0A0A8Y8A7_ARUDO